MTARQGKMFVAGFMTVTLGMVVAGIGLAIWTKNMAWLLLCFAFIFYP